jgi:hypothetical protein
MQTTAQSFLAYGLDNDRSQAEQRFIESFALATHQTLPAAREQWAGFSRNLSDTERDQIEQGGTISGGLEGASYLELYPLA